MKFTAPRMDDTPNKCKEKMAAKCTDAPACAGPFARGRYTARSVPAPFSTILLVSGSARDGGSGRNLIYSLGCKCLVLLVLVALVSFSKMPIMIAITIKKENYNAEVSCNKNVVDLVISD